MFAIVGAAVSLGVAVATAGSATALAPTPYSVDLHNGSGTAGPYVYGVIGGSYMNGFRGTSFSGSDEIQYDFATPVDMDVDLVGFNHSGECIDVLQPFTVVNLPAGMSVNGSNVCAVQDGLPNLLQTEIFLESQQFLTLDPNGGTSTERVGLDQLSVGDPTTGGTGGGSTSTSISVGAQSGDYNDADAVSATLTSNSGAAVSGEPLTFTLNGTETCTATTDSAGVGSCTLTPAEAAGGYSLAVSFGGDAGASLLGSSQSTTFTVNRDEARLTYTGSTTSNYNDPFTASATLVDPDGGMPISGKAVTFALANGDTCTNTTGADGSVSCSITPTGPAGSGGIDATFAGDGYFQPASTSVPFAVTLEEAKLIYTGATTSDFHDAFTASATLTDPDGGAPIVGKLVTFALGTGDTCSGTTASDGTVSCSITPTQPAGAYSVSADFAGDSYYQSTSAAAPFTITHEETALLYTGATEVANGYPATLAASLLEDGVSPIAGRTVMLKLGSGSSAQVCSATTDGAGTASCTITRVEQPDSPPLFILPVSATFSGDAYYVAAEAGRSVDLLYYTGRSYAAAVNRLLVATPDTGEVTTAQWIDPRRSLASIKLPGVSVTVLGAEVKTGQKVSAGTAGVLDATIALPGLPKIQIGAIHAASSTTCAGSTGTATIASLRIGGIAYATVTTSANATIKIGGLTVVLNQQIPIPGGLTVNAVAITGPLGLSIVLSSATSDIHNCT